MKKCADHLTKDSFILFQEYSVIYRGIPGNSFWRILTTMLCVGSYDLWRGTNRNFAKNATVLRILFISILIKNKNLAHKHYTSILEKRRKIGKVPDNINDPSLLSFYLEISFKHLLYSACVTYCWERVFWNK